MEISKINPKIYRKNGYAYYKIDHAPIKTIINRLVNNTVELWMFSQFCGVFNFPFAPRKVKPEKNLCVNEIQLM